jgi:hypothetical protein
MPRGARRSSEVVLGLTGPAASGLVAPRIAVPVDRRLATLLAVQAFDGAEDEVARSSDVGEVVRATWLAPIRADVLGGPDRGQPADDR